MELLPHGAGMELLPQMEAQPSSHLHKPAHTSTFTLWLQHEAVGVSNGCGSYPVTLFTLAGKDGNRLDIRKDFFM